RTGIEQLVPAVLRTGGQKRPCGAFLERGRFPYGSQVIAPPAQAGGDFFVSVRGSEQGGAPQCATNSPVDCSLARGRFSVRVTGHCSPSSGWGVIFMFPYEELLRRRPPPAADAGSRSRAAGRRGQAPPKGR